MGGDRADIDFPGGASSATSSLRRSRSDTIADQDDAHPHIETTDEPGAGAKAVSRCIKVSGRNSYISRV
jgi:hypothetical protein